MSSMMRFCSGVRLSAARADPVDAGLEASGKTAATSVKIPKDVADEMESVLKGLGTNFSQAMRLLALQTTALGDAVRCRHPP